MPRRALLVLALAAASAFPLRRALSQAPDYQGLSGSLMLGGTRYTLADGEHPAHFIGGLGAGYRWRIPGIARVPVYLTPHVSLAITQLRGIRLESSEIGFSQVNAGLQLAARVGRVRPYALWQGGKATVERYEGDYLVNYYGSAPTWGAGVEIPFDNPCGAGLDIQLRRTSGTFGHAEARPPATPSTGDAFRATTLTVGWSGRFRGGRLLFACH